ncbi:MAG: hypothetical protein ACRDNZ_05785 [Streptosporangiaceae bacterium]
MTRYLVVLEIQHRDALTDERLCDLTDALLDVEDGDRQISDCDVAARLARGAVDVQMIVDADDPAEAATKALCAVRTAIHAIGDATPGWETSPGMMRIAPAEVSGRLFA